MKRKCEMIIANEGGREGPSRNQWIVVLLAAAHFLSPGPAAGQTPRDRPSDALHQLNNSIEALVQRVSPAVVQILVTGYGSAEDRNQKQTNDVIGRRQAIGSGVIVDPDGYIVTNAHVVNGAEKIEVIVPPRNAPTSLLEAAQDNQGKSYQARIVGVTREIDLAVIKIEAHALPALSVRSSSPPPRQGEMVLAFGSPEGLRNTVTMGVVSAVARQPDPDSPLVYIQTDAAINPGNSGGPLVNVDGQVVGVSTFILSQSGGNEGLGFAIPSGVVGLACRQLRKFGHLHRAQIGIGLQTITPTLAAALHLPRNYGVVISDVSPDSPAAASGLQIGDALASIDGRPADNLPFVAFHFYSLEYGQRVHLEVLRGKDRLSFDEIGRASCRERV